MIRLIATDMDGTLLNSSHEISQENIDAIKYAQSKGITVAIATGRAFYEAHGPVKAAGLKMPYICLNGAEVRDEARNIIYTSRLMSQQIQRIRNILNKYDIFYQVYTNFGIYTEDKEKDLEIFLDIIRRGGGNPDVEKIRLGVEQRIKNGTLKVVDSYDTIYNRDGEIVMKLLAYSPNLELVDKAIAELKEYHSLAISSSSRGNIEITHNNAQKGVAVCELAERLKVSMDEVMTLGDNLNDISMLERSKYAIGMANGADEVKAIATDITETNDNSGVGKAIMKYVKEQYEL